MKKILTLLCFLACSTIFTGCQNNFNPQEKIDINLQGKTFHLKTAKTEKERELGLSEIKTLEPSEGMLFLFSEKKILSFWMKDTFIPLQIIFIDDCKIIDIQKMEVEKNPAQPIKTYQSKLPADKAIELNTGSVDPKIIGQEIKELCK